MSLGVCSQSRFCIPALTLFVQIGGKPNTYLVAAWPVLRWIAVSLRSPYNIGIFRFQVLLAGFLESYVLFGLALVVVVLARVQPGRVSQSDRIVPGVAVFVKSLGINDSPAQRVGGDPAAQGAAVVSRPEVVVAALAVAFFAGELVLVGR